MNFKLSQTLAIIGFFVFLGVGCAGKSIQSQEKWACRPYGSAELLHALWTPEQLAGTPDDIKGQPPLATPDFSGPTRRRPEHTLPPAVPGHIRAVTIPHELFRSTAAAGAAVQNPNVVSLTFDLCELATRVTGYNAELVNLLRRENIPATFFAGGKWMRDHPEKTMQLMADPLFEIGNHNWTHGNMGVMTDAEMRNQILFTQAQYELLREQLARRAAKAGLSSHMAAIPQVPTLYRLPYARSSLRAVRLIAELGLTSVLWDCQGEEATLPTIFPHISRSHIATGFPPGSIVAGSILLAHGNGIPKHTNANLPRIIRQLKANGFNFLTVSELLQRGTSVRTDQGFFMHPGDNAVVDRMFGNGTVGSAWLRKHKANKGK